MFAKPKAVKLSDGSPLTNLLTVPALTTVKQAVAETKKTTVVANK